MNRFLISMAVLCMLSACSAQKSVLRVDQATYNRMMEEATASASATIEKTLKKYSTPAPADFATLPEFTPDVLCNVFDTNREIADELYEGKWMKVRGTLSFGPVTLSTRVQSVELEKNGKQMTFRFFEKEAQEPLSKLKHGQELVIAGMYISGGDSSPGLMRCRIINTGLEKQ